MAQGVGQAFNPITNAQAALHAARQKNLPLAVLNAAAIFPFGFGKAAELETRIANLEKGIAKGGPWEGFRRAELKRAQEELKRTPKAAPATEKAAKAGGLNAPKPTVSPEVLTPEKQVLGAVGAARRRYAAQETLRKAERAKRAGQLGPAFEAAGGGVAGHRAALAQLKGELPKLRFDNLTALGEDDVHHLLNAAHSADLLPLEKLNLREAILRAHAGQVPRPFEIKLVEKAFGPDAALELASTTPYHQEILRLMEEVANVPRSVMASFDVSAPFRQGLVAAAMNPRLFAKNLGPMFKMLVSEKRYGQIMEEITQRPSYETMVSAKLKLTDLGDLTTREEQFMSNLAEKLTGGKYGFVRASSRAYTGFLNRMRADLFDSLSRDLADAAAAEGIPDAVLHRDIAKTVNWATGRGELYALEPAAVVLNTVLFSPRLFASRLQTFNPVFYARLNPVVRKQALGATMKLVAAGSTIIGLAALAGAKVVTDPRNADWGKIKVGNTRFDIWGGHQQIARLVSQLATGAIVSSTTGKTLRLKGGYSLSRQDIAKRFLEGKLAPTPSLINDWFRGSDFADKPFSWKRAIVSRSYPLIIQDALDIQHDTGSFWKPAVGFGIGAFGVGVQNYGGSPPSSGGSGPVWGMNRGDATFSRTDTPDVWGADRSSGTISRTDTSGVWGGGKR